MSTDKRHIHRLQKILIVAAVGLRAFNLRLVRLFVSAFFVDGLPPARTSRVNLLQDTPSVDLTRSAVAFSAFGYRIASLAAIAQPPRAARPIF